MTLVAMAGLAFSEPLGRALHAALGATAPSEARCTLGALALSWALFEVGTGLCYSVFLALIADVVPREVIGRFFALFRIVSLAAGILFNFYLFGKVEQHYVPVFLGIGVLYAFGFTAMCLKVREGTYPTPPPAGSGSAPRRIAAGVRTYFRDCFGLSYYRWVFLAYGLYWVAMVPLDLFVVFYAKSLGMDMATLGKYTALQLSLSLVQAYPMGWLADRLHPLRLSLAALALLVVSAFGAFAFVHDARSFGLAYVICGTLTGTWATSVSSVPAVLFGKARYATFNSAWIASQAFGTMIAGPACGWMLDLRGHDYRHTFLWAGTIGLAAWVAALVVYRKFQGYGGTRGYRPPGEEKAEDAAFTPAPAHGS